MQRFYLEEPVAADTAEIELPAHVSRQISTVLRMRPGQEIAVFDRTGREWLAELTHLDRAVVRARLGASRPVQAAARRITLCVALLKGERMEWVLQKGTEIGVESFRPMLTERVIAAKTSIPERWSRIVIEAVEQSGGTHVPSIEAPVEFPAALSTPEPKVFCWEQERSTAFLAALPWRDVERATVYVGPEGGFTEREAEQAVAAGAQLASLGPRILRAETAAIAASALALLAP